MVTKSLYCQAEAAQKVHRKMGYTVHSADNVDSDPTCELWACTSCQNVRTGIRIAADP